MRNIVIFRTSTVKQEAEEQRKETLEYARSFNADNIIEVGGTGLSAIKLDEEYVRNIDKICDLVDEGDIECIYAWSIDRIGRNEELLMRFKNKLIEKKVQLRIKNPSLYLLNDDGSVNSGMEIAFSLFATMSKQEMMIKKERFKRSKKRNKEQKRYNGGKIKFGYAVDDDGYYIPSPVNAPHVRDIFNLYAFSPVSINYLAKLYISKGVLPDSEVNANSLINRMLKDKGYIGQTFYPRLVDDSTFEAVQEKLKEFRIQPKVKYKVTPYYCQGLIYDISEDGREVHRMRVKKSEVSYVSYTEKFSLSINNIDSLVLELLNILIRETDFNAFSASIDGRLEELSKREEILQQEAENVAKKDVELDERYFLGQIRNYDSLKKQLELKSIHIKKELDLINENRLKLLSEKETEKPVDLYSLDDDGRRGMFLKYIDRVLARKLDKWESVIYVECQTTLGTSVNVIYNRKEKAYRFTDRLEYNKIKVVRSIIGRIRKSSC